MLFKNFLKKAMLTIGATMVTRLTLLYLSQSLSGVERDVIIMEVCVCVCLRKCAL